MRIAYFPSHLPGNASSIHNKVLSAMTSTGDTPVEGAMDADAAVIWSVLWANRMSRNKHVWDTYRKLRRPVIVLEVGGLIRDKTWRLSINGINRSALFPRLNRLDADRPHKLGLQLLPWHGGEYVLICGQHEKSQQWQGMPPMDDYYKQTILSIRRYTQRPIVVRSHPRYRENIFFRIDDAFYKQHGIEWNTPHKIRSSYDSYDLEPLLDHCHCVISHSSNSGLTAIMRGTPAIVSQQSLAYDMGTSDLSLIESLPRPDRQQWFIELCHKEWLEDELTQAWQGLRHHLNS